MKLLPLIFIFTLFSSVSCTDNSSATTGTENPTLVKLANAAGIETIEACTLVMLTTGQY